MVRACARAWNGRGLAFGGHSIAAQCGMTGEGRMQECGAAGASGEAVRVSL